MHYSGRYLAVKATVVSTSYRIFGAVAPGLEPAALHEAQDILGVDAEVRAGGVAFSGDLDTLRAAVTQLRIPEGIRVRVSSFPAKNFGELETGFSRIQWHAWTRSATADVRVTCRKSKLYHSGAVAERLLTALANARKKAKSPTDPGEGPRVFVRVARDTVTVSVDATGEPAHKRGWDKSVARAGLRETLASGALRAAGALDHDVLWDPFCGAGTLGAEWMSAKRGMPVFADREFAMDGWPAIASALGDVVTADIPAAVSDDSEAGEGADAAAPTPQFFGSDLEPSAIRAAKDNADRRGFTDFNLRVADVREAADGVPEGAAVICNLPYGKRLHDVRPALAAFGDMLRGRPDLGPVHALDGSGMLGKASRLQWERVLRLDNRGLPVDLMRLVR